jgi:hypothetical protein
MPHLIEVMVLGGHPEDWNGVDAGLREFVRDLDRAQRFVKRVCRAAEESDLLPAEDGDGSVGEAVDVFRGRCAAAERSVRLAQDSGYFLATAVGVIERLCGLLNRFEGRRVRVELRNAEKVIQEPKKQLRLVGQALERYRETTHRRLDDPHQDWSHCQPCVITSMLHAARALQLLRWGQVPIQPGIQRLDALAKARIAQRLAEQINTT